MPGAGLHREPLGLDGFNRLTERQWMNMLFGVCSSTI
ncbi:MAG: hypothetical protein QOH82_2945, partial [Mycobacterium sp.]|nr:hypothetical protein [Mycobacterium sp.]